MHAEVDLQDDQGWTALHHAAANNSSECMAVLISEGADKRIRDFNRRRPINIAKFKNFGKCIAVLSNKSSLN
jgi:ankyrin repeat protein